MSVDSMKSELFGANYFDQNLCPESCVRDFGKESTQLALTATKIKPS